MDNKEIILAKITEIISKDGFLIKENSELKKRLKCSGLKEYFEKYSVYLIPYEYNNYNRNEYKNINLKYDVFTGLDNIFEELYKENKIEKIIVLLKELTKSFNIEFINMEMQDDFNELTRLYELLGLSIKLESDKIIITSYFENNAELTDKKFSVESWLKREHHEVYESYKSAIDSYSQGNIGACIESCRTCLASIFSKYKETEKFSKWLRGVYNINEEKLTESPESDLNKILKELKNEDLAKFFCENINGNLTKVKMIYLIYQMMSDYGTHRNEQAIEKPSLEDALISLRLLESILIWVYLKKGYMC